MKKNLKCDEPALYGSQFRNQLQIVVKNATTKGGSFVIGIPAAASTTEFSHYISSRGAPRIGLSHV